MTEVWCSGSVLTKAIVHGGGGWQNPLKRCQFLPSLRTCTHTQTHAHALVIMKQSPTSGGAYRTAGKAWHPSTHGPLTPAPTIFAYRTVGGSVPAHAHTHTHCIQPLQPLYCVSALFSFLQPIPALPVQREEVCFC